MEYFLAAILGALVFGGLPWLIPAVRHWAERDIYLVVWKIFDTHEYDTGNSLGQRWLASPSVRGFSSEDGFERSGVTAHLAPAGKNAGPLLIGEARVQAFSGFDAAFAVYSSSASAQPDWSDTPRCWMLVTRGISLRAAEQQYFAGGGHAGQQRRVVYASQLAAPSRGRLTGDVPDAESPSS